MSYDPILTADRGDLGGTPASPKVVGLQGNPVSPSAPATGNLLTWNGTLWVAAALAFQPSVAPSSVALSVNASVSPNVVTATPSYGSAVEANGSRYEWQVRDPATLSTTGSGLPNAVVVGQYNGSGTNAGKSSDDGTYTLAASPDGNGNSYYTGPGGYICWVAQAYSSPSPGWVLGPYLDPAVSGGGPTAGDYRALSAGSTPTVFPTTGWQIGGASGPVPTFTTLYQNFVGPDGTASTYWTGPALVSGQDGVPALTSANSPLVFQVRSRGDSLGGTAAATPSSWVQSSSLSFLGPASPPAVASVVTGNYTVSPNVDTFVVANAAGNNITITLPNPATYSGPAIRVSRNDASSTYTVTVASGGSGTITGSASLTSQYQTKAYVVLSGGSGWYQF